MWFIWAFCRLLISASALCFLLYGWLWPLGIVRIGLCGWLVSVAEFRLRCVFLDESCRAGLRCLDLGKHVGLGFRREVGIGMCVSNIIGTASLLDVRGYQSLLCEI